MQRPGAVDRRGVKIDRHNPNVKIFVMASILMSTRFGVEQSAAKADEYLSKYPHFQTVIESMIRVFERSKDGAE